MGCFQSKQTCQNETISNLQNQVDELREQLDTNKNNIEETPFATAVAVAEIVYDENDASSFGNGKLQDSKNMNVSFRVPSAPSLPNDEKKSLGLDLDDSNSDSNTWDYVDGGDIRIGPGSYYCDDSATTIINQSITNEDDAQEFVQRYSGSKNPVVMWQIVYEDDVPMLCLHRLSYMYKNLDADSNKPPKHYAESTKGFLRNNKTWGKRGRIFVRSNEWWTSCNNSKETGNNSKVTVEGNIHPSFELEEGRFCVFSAAFMADLIGNDSWVKSKKISSLTSSTHIKENQGTVLRARNERSGVVGGLLIWTDGGRQAVGCWNPVEFSKETDWKIGDVITFLNPINSTFAPVLSYKTKAGTGWNIPAQNIRFGQCGLVGAWWKELEVEFTLAHKTILSAVWTDSVELPYSIMYENEMGDWIKLKDGCTGISKDVSFRNASAKKWKVCWESTDMHKSHGLSTMRGGGGFHVELLL